MRSKFCKLICAGALTISPAFPDIINIAVNGSVAGSGYIQVVCGLATPGCMGGPFPFMPPVFTVPYSFSAMNTGLGPVGGFGIAQTPSGLLGATAGSFADQDVEATADSIQISLIGGYMASGGPHSFQTSESDNVSVSFDLTGQSIVQLSGGGFGLPAPNDIGELLGPGGDILLDVPNFSVPVSTELQPGTYELVTSANAMRTGNYLTLPPTNTWIDFESGLSAEFTPVVTLEPRGVLLGALLVALSGGCVVRLRAKPRQQRA